VHVREEQAALKEEHQRRLTTKESEQNHVGIIANPQHLTAQRSGDSQRYLDDLFRNDCFPCPPNHPPLKTSPTSLVLYLDIYRIPDPL
jgi:hypothetical protein